MSDEIDMTNISYTLPHTVTIISEDGKDIWEFDSYGDAIAALRAAAEREAEIERLRAENNRLETEVEMKRSIALRLHDEREALKERVHRIDMLVETWESPDMVALINSVRLLARLPTSAPVSREADNDE